MTQPTAQFRAITDDKFIDDFKPTTNTIEKNASFNGWMYETYGEELKAVEAAFEKDPGTVWTIVESDGIVSYTNGMHYVNRLGYIITEVSLTNHPDYEGVTFVEATDPEDLEDRDDDDEDFDNDEDDDEQLTFKP